MFDRGFIRSEFECGCGCGFDTVDIETIYVLEELKRWFGRPIQVNSGCRCHAYNIFVGGSKKSQHVFGRAADVVVQGIDPLVVYNYLDKKYPDKYGMGKYKTFTHIDTRSYMARWEV